MIERPPSSISNPTVLVTSVGSGVGCSIVRSLRMSARPYRIIGANSDPVSAGVFDCDVAYAIPPIAEEQHFLERLFRIIEIERPDFVLAGRDQDVCVLSRYREDIARLGGFALVGDPSAVSICNDKYATFQTFKNSDIAFARTAVGASEVEDLVASCGFPLICKPRMGGGSRGVRVIQNREDLRSLKMDEGKMVLQEYLVPDVWMTEDFTDINYLDAGGNLRQEEEYSAQVLIGSKHDVIGLFMSKNKLSHGAPIHIETVYQPEFERLSRKCAAKLALLGLIGPCNLQAKKTTAGFVAFEINARFTGLTSTRSAMGFKEVEATYDYFVGHNAFRHLLEFNPGQHAYRYLSESIFMKEDIEVFKGGGFWRASL